MTNKLVSYAHKHFGFDAGHAIMGLMLSVLTLMSPSVVFNVVTSLAVTAFFAFMVRSSSEGLYKNVAFSLLLAVTLGTLMTLATTFFPGNIVAACLAGSFGYMVPKELYDMSRHEKFKVKLDNVCDALSYNLLSWPLLLLLTNNHLEAGIFGLLIFMTYALFVDWKLSET